MTTKPKKAKPQPMWGVKLDGEIIAAYRSRSFARVARTGNDGARVVKVEVRELP